MKNFKSYGFWTALAGAITILASALGKCFGFSVNNEIITDVIMAIAGVLVVLGVVTMPKKENNKESDKIEQSQEEQADKLNQNNDNKLNQNDEQNQEDK